MVQLLIGEEPLPFFDKEEEVQFDCDHKARLQIIQADTSFSLHDGPLQ